MTRGYNESYLADARKNLGDMLEYALCDLGYDADIFFGYFIVSGIAEKFGNGNPKYIAGMSGVELAETVLKTLNIPFEAKEILHTDFKGAEYWSGWIFAYYQWYTGRRFEDIVNDGLNLSTVICMYILHEADESKFIETANEIIARNKEGRKSKLSIIRKARGFTQAELANHSSVALRMIQLYEQKQNDINKAQADTVLVLAKVLGCKAEDILE